MTEEDLQAMEKELLELRGRFFAGDKSVEGKLRQLSARLSEVRANPPQPSQPQQQQNQASPAWRARRRRCCGR